MDPADRGSLPAAGNQHRQIDAECRDGGRAAEAVTRLLDIAALGDPRNGCIQVYTQCRNSLRRSRLRFGLDVVSNAYRAATVRERSLRAGSPKSVKRSTLARENSTETDRLRLTYPACIESPQCDTGSLAAHDACLSAHRADPIA